MTCVACRRASAHSLCRYCLATLAPAPDRLVGRVLVRSAFAHEGAARRLVHRLKYEAVSGVAERLARAMVPLLPPDCTALIPLLRVSVRRRRYGVDSAVELAEAVAALSGLPVVRALRPGLWRRRRAGSASGQRRGVPGFARAAPIPPGSVLVDDVVTTGSTIRAATAVSGVVRAVTATAACRRLGRDPGV